MLWGWCLRRETSQLVPQLALISPIFLVELYCWLFWPADWRFSQGREFLLVLFAIAAMAIVGLGAIHASQSICWEVSAELRELVRLTGVGPITLLCCKTLARWLTVALSVLLLAPAVCFAMTLGGTTLVQLYAIGWVLLMLMVLTAGFALVAGVSATEVQNSSTTATLGTFILLVLYHMVFWFTAAAIYIGSWLVTGSWHMPPGSWIRFAFNLASNCAPISVLWRTGWAPEVFSPLDPAYWMHFLTAFYLMRIATVVMVNRFRSIRYIASSEEETAAAVSAPNLRPRCYDAALYWKDSRVLTGGVRSMTTFSTIYILLAVVIFVTDVVNRSPELQLTLAILSLCAAPIMFAVRLDSLISSEFRQQTWQGLMLLPIDRRSILWAKIRAVAWEQKLVLLPIAISFPFGWRHAPVGLPMIAAIATLAMVLLCQVSALYYLTPRYWWTGPLHAFLMLALVIICMMTWIQFSMSVGFFMTVMLMIVTIIPVQHYIHTCVQDWTEL